MSPSASARYATLTAPDRRVTGPEAIGATTVAWTTKKLAQSTVAPVAPFSTLPPMAIASGAASNAAR